MKIVVLGIGNLLLSDEAVGVRIVETLAHQYRFTPEVTLLDGGTSGMEFLADIAHCDLLIVADAVLTGKMPGAITLLYDSDVPAFFTQKISPHQLGLADVLMALRLTDEYPRRLALVGVEPASLASAIGMSECVGHAIQPALATITALLRQHGIQVEQVTSAPPPRCAALSDAHYPGGNNAPH